MGKQSWHKSWLSFWVWRWSQLSWRAKRCTAVVVVVAIASKTKSKDLPLLPTNKKRQDPINLPPFPTNKSWESGEKSHVCLCLVEIDNNYRWIYWNGIENVVINFWQQFPIYKNSSIILQLSKHSWTQNYARWFSIRNFNLQAEKKTEQIIKNYRSGKLSSCARIQISLFILFE